VGISGDDGGNGVDSRQLILVSVCLFGLVTAAFLAPVTNENEPIGVDGGVVPTGLIADLVEFLLGQSPDCSAWASRARTSQLKDCRRGLLARARARPS